MITPRGFDPGSPLDKPFPLKSHPGLAMAVHPPEVPAPGRGSPSASLRTMAIRARSLASHGRPVTCRSRSCMSHRMRQRTGRLSAQCTRSRSLRTIATWRASSITRSWISRATTGRGRRDGICQSRRKATAVPPLRTPSWDTCRRRTSSPIRSAFHLTVGQAIRSCYDSVPISAGARDGARRKSTRQCTVETKRKGMFIWFLFACVCACVESVFAGRRDTCRSLNRPAWVHAKGNGGIGFVSVTMGRC